MTAVDPLLQEAEQRIKTITIGKIEATVRELNMIEFAGYGEAMAGKGKDDTARTEAIARMLSTAVIKEDGAPRWSLAEARKVANTARIATPLVAAIMELSGFGIEPAKKD